MAMTRLMIHLSPPQVHNSPYNLPLQAFTARHPPVCLMATTRHLLICTTPLLARYSAPSSPLSPTRHFAMWLIRNSPLSNFISWLVVAQLAYS
ncbi:hypothetical protein PVK06_011446 [Gossypium arboreum]|uniref:Uncharacterized protein n=1 Tax=Gossypium arboreum TaxID=29729 RepID=A0ABR0Q9N0_GOSAR|nr:hypothetical protein PVK06_011446 [Gossypium arboreum]